MANAGEISVELRLLLTKLKGDISAAAKQVKEGMNAQVGQTATGTEKAATAQEKLTRKVKDTTRALKEQKEAALAAWRASLPAPVIRDLSRPASQSVPQYIAARTIISSRIPYRPLKKMPFYHGSAPPVISPPIIAPPVIPASGGAGGSGINWNSAISGAGGFMGRFGLSGAASAMRAGPIGVAIAAVVVGLLAMRRALQETVNAMERARQLYARQLTSGGLSAGFVAHRSALANVLGVGEQEVYHYAGAIKGLSERMAWSSKITAENYRGATEASWAWKALGEDIKAAWMRVANDLGPALRALANGLSVMVRLFSDLRQVFVDMAAKIPLLTANFRSMASLFAIAGTLAGGGSIKDALKAGREAFNSPFNTGTVDAGNPPASARRLAVSAWERMGLVLGVGGGTNWAEQTAKNTRQLVTLLSRSLNGGPNYWKPGEAPIPAVQ